MFTCKWLPTDCEPKALVFLCHGYAMECSVSMKGIYIYMHIEFVQFLLVYDSEFVVSLLFLLIQN